LTVAAPVVFGRLHVLPVIETLLRAHPALRVRLALSDRIVHLVEEGVDVAVRIGDLADSALTAVKVGEVRPVLVASPAYLAARGEPADLSALKGHDLIVFEGLARTQTWRFGQAEETLVRVAPKLAVNGADAALAAAEHGSGIASALSYQAAEAVSAGRLRIVLADHAPPAVPVSLVYPGQRLGSANVRAFLDVARPELKAGLARLAALLR
jgi:DNA-binding transcriptional LysR family regulator